MATVYSTINDSAAVAGSQDPPAVEALATAVLGIVGANELSNEVEGGHVTKANMGFAGGHAVIDDVTYVDGDDGKVGAADAGAFVPGYGYSQGYRHEKSDIDDTVAYAAQTSLEPVGISADVALKDQNA